MTETPAPIRCAVVGPDGVVARMVDWDGVTDWYAGDGATVVVLAKGAQADVGWTWNGATLAPPAQAPQG